MMHAFPRTFSLATSRAERVRPPAIDYAPLTPAAYLRLCREAASMTPMAVAVLLAPRPRHLTQAVELLGMLETPGNVARKDETLERLRAAFPFDPDVYRQLSTEPPERHPRVCRGCATSTWAVAEGIGPLRWANDNACTRCAGVEGDGDAE